MQLTIAIITSVLATLIFSICLNSRKSIFPLLALLVLPVASLIFIDPQFASVGWHEFMHGSTVFNIMNGQVPPEDVLLAGYPLKYPWAHHYLVALLCQTLHIAPSIGFDFFDVFALIVSAIIIFKIGQLLHPQLQTGFFAVFLAFFGTSIFFLQPLLKLGAAPLLDQRALPLYKFASANSNSLGFCLFFVCLFFLIRLFSHRGKLYLEVSGLSISIAALAFIYPICWLAFVVSCVCVCVGHLLTRSRQEWDWKIILLILFALSFGSWIAMPYLHSIGSGKASTADMFFSFRPHHLMDVSIALLLILSLPVAILWIERKSIRASLNQRSSEFLTIFFSGVGIVLLYISVLIPTGSQYKFLMLLMSVTGILISPFFTSFYQKNFWLGKSIVALLLLPTVLIHYTILAQTKFVDSVYTDGVNVRHYDSRMDKFYSWIASKTPKDTVVVDSFLSIPELGQRSLYVGTDLRRKEDNFKLDHDKFTADYFDGWSMDASTVFSQVYGENQEVVESRLKNAMALLKMSSKEGAAAAAVRIKQELGKRPVIIVVRSPATNIAFEKNPRFKLEYDEDSIWVYSIKDNALDLNSL